MELYIKAGNAIKHDLEKDGYDVEVGINRFTDTITVKINERGTQKVQDLVPHVFNIISDEDDEYLFTIDEEEVEEYIEENYDEDEFEEV